MGDKFGITDPANNIYELVEYLESTSSDEKYYRGQNRMYPSNAPSALRPAAKLTGLINEWVQLDDEYWKKAPDKVRARGDLRTALMNTYGPALANLLTQQYGITSDGYDLTAEPSIAGFFATRLWPGYEHFAGTKDNSVGVIYRFNIGDQSDLNSKTIDATRRSLYYVIEGGAKIWFEKVFQYKDMLLYGLTANKKVPELSNLIKKQKLGEVSAVELIRPTSYIRGTTFKRLYVEFAKRAKLRGNPAAEYMNSRSFAQHGGIMFPAYKHNALVSANIQITRHDGKNLYPSNPTAISLGATHIYELNVNPYVEKFFFKHSEKEMKIDSLTLLWPSREKDPVYYYLYEVAKIVCKEYLSDYSTAPDDFDKGVIDPGFKTTPIG